MPRFRRTTRRRYGARTRSRVSKRYTTSSRRSVRTRRVTRRPTMTRKRILNTSSTKKRDTMLGWNGTAAAPTQIGPGSPTVIPFLATYRTLDANSVVFDEASRTKSLCYMRGLAENIVFNTNDSTPWQARVIGFTFKGPTITNDAATYFVQGSNGVLRSASPYQLASVPTLRSLLFRGATAIDWLDPQIAPLDTRNLNIMMDRRVDIRSGNGFGTFKRIKFWHPLNKNLKYNDDEHGGGEDASGVSTFGQQGMGDYYVIIVVTALGAPLTTSLCNVEFNSTLYWHEK